MDSEVYDEAGIHLYRYFYSGYVEEHKFIEGWNYNVFQKVLRCQFLYDKSLCVDKLFIATQEELDKIKIIALMQ
jgi:hypothetical protein